MTKDIERMLHESPEYRQEQLSAALDGMLTPGEQTALDAHLGGCEACAYELEELRQVRALLRHVPEPALPRSFLLPAEGELVASGGPAPVVAHESPANVTPLRQPTRYAARTLQVTRWLGTIAAVLGMALFLGSLLMHQGTLYSLSAPTSMQSGGSNPAAAGRTATGATNPAPTHDLDNGGEQSAGKTATVTPAPTLPASSSVTPTATLVTNAPGPAPGDVLRVVALALLFGGIVLALASFIVARRI